MVPALVTDLWIFPILLPVFVFNFDFIILKEKNQVKAQGWQISFSKKDKDEGIEIWINSVTGFGIAQEQNNLITGFLGCNTEIKAVSLCWFSFHSWNFPIHEMKKQKKKNHFMCTFKNLNFISVHLKYSTFY